MNDVPPRHPAQDRILQVIRERPGVCVQDLAEDLRLTRTATLHHLRRLMKEGLVSSRRQGRRVLHFTDAVRPAAHGLMGLMHVHTARRVVEHLARDPGASWRTLAKQLGVTPRAVRWHIRNLEKEQALRVQASAFGPGHIAVLSPGLRALLENNAGPAGEPPVGPTWEARGPAPFEGPGDFSLGISKW